MMTKLRLKTVKIVQTILKRTNPALQNHHQDQMMIDQRDPHHQKKTDQTDLQDQKLTDHTDPQHQNLTDQTHRNPAQHQTDQTL